MVLAITACTPEVDIAPYPSTDLAALRNVLKLPIPFQTATWEVFRYPEPTNGFVAYNYEKTLLIAEVSPVDRRWFESTATIEMEYPAQNAIRQWLTASSKNILKKTPIGKPDNPCRYYSTTIESGAPVVGYACLSDQKALLYFILDFAS
ncbi:hypothetical protein KY495_18685 [Massilia sp. PAMC28688]|uniref:hypothetical protein n=1 Tax=Massilia sp. PAMC28688 TaxID=2861283 RepID=UPI001C636F91|nr:hypothetical protein [Massilia sp. PAMC28688]QYF92737.1 hypothetical protein KY495_18685 [Massilia sp. PAMC28688]